MIYDIVNFPYEYVRTRRVLPRPSGNPHGRRKIRYLDCMAAFDIETTRLSDIEQAIMYVWQFQIDEYTIMGRTWEEFTAFLRNLKQQLHPGVYMVIWVHNLSYEFQYLRGIYDFAQDEVFATEPHKVLKCEMAEAFEFRCSYYQTNMSLAQFTKKMGVPDAKLSGFDYKKIRYPWTPLSEEEIHYCINDVRGLVQALRIEMASDGDTLYTIPLTSTGYVRRDCRKAMEGFNHRQLVALLPGPEVYRLLRDAFRGGDTHANRWYVGEIVEGPGSDDRSSAYPADLCLRMYPMGEWFIERDCSARQLKRLLRKYHKAFVTELCLYDVREKNAYNGRPYLSDAKCRNVEGAKIDNGRIISADYLETTITDVDLLIMLDCYDFKMRPKKIASCKYGYLPGMLTDVVKDYYRKKTALKGVESERIYYEKSKARLNACYGMMAQDPVKDSVLFIDNDFVIEDRPLEELLSKSYKKAFLSYAWGVWCTAWARYALHKAIKIAAESDGSEFLYCDTDSVKYIGDIDLSELNEATRAECIKRGAYADDPQGVRHYMGVFEDEGRYKRFCTLGAKKYVYEDMQGKLHITIAGVSKRSGAEELGKIENFKEGFTFIKAGGTEAIYNDKIDMWVEREGHQLHITDNVVIRPDIYTLGLAGDYKRILDGVMEIKYSAFEMPGLYRFKK